MWGKSEYNLEGPFPRGERNRIKSVADLMTFVAEYTRHKGMDAWILVLFWQTTNRLV